MMDGRVIEGETYDGVVASMADEKFVKPTSIQRYRSAVASRVSSGYGVVVDATTNESFVESLEAAGLMKPV